MKKVAKYVYAGNWLVSRFSEWYLSKRMIGLPVSLVGLIQVAKHSLVPFWVRKPVSMQSSFVRKWEQSEVE